MKTANFKQQKGFTLIELIIVIIILGILAVTAAPKFLDIQTDAQQSAMSGIAGAVRSANQISHSAALIDTDGTITLEGVNYSTDDGYVLAADMCQLVDLLSGSQSDGEFSLTLDGAYTCKYEDGAAATDGDVVYIYPADFAAPNAADPGNCYVSYTDASGVNGTPDTAISISISSDSTCDDRGTIASGEEPS